MFRWGFILKLWWGFRCSLLDLVSFGIKIQKCIGVIHIENGAKYMIRVEGIHLIPHRINLRKSKAILSTKPSSLLFLLLLSLHVSFFFPLTLSISISFTNYLLSRNLKIFLIFFLKTFIILNLMLIGSHF